MRLMRIDSTCALVALAVCALMASSALAAEAEPPTTPDETPSLVTPPATTPPATESPEATALPPIADDPLDHALPSLIDEKLPATTFSSCNSCDTACSSACEQGRYFFRAEHLFLKPRRRLLEYAITDTDTLVNDNGWLPGQPLSLDLERHAGMRLNLGRRVSDDGWVFLFTYTYLHSDDYDSVTAPANGELHPTLTHPAGTNTGTSEQATTASAFANLDYDVLDFELARQLQIGDSLQSQFGAGVRLGYIDQEFMARYSGGDFTEDGLVNLPTFFDGYGLRAANETVWDVPNVGLQFFGRVAGSLMTGNFTNYHQELRGDPTVVYLHDKFSKVVPVIELAVGVGMERRIGAWTLGLSFGYEMTNWFGLVEQRTFVDDTRDALSVKQVSDLALDGYFIRFSFTR